MIPIGILFPLPAHRVPTPPASTAFGRAALLAAPHGLDVRLGVPRDAMAVRDGRWVPAPTDDVAAWVHRFPDGDHPDAWARAQAHVTVPLVNPPSLVRLCRDKLACQRTLEAAGLLLPEVTHTDLPDALAAWGAAFLKPRFGAFGRGVRRVAPGEALPVDGDWVLQRAIPAPAGWAGVSVRVLVQREPGGDWVVTAPAVRRDRHDPVVNHARGATVDPEDVLTAPAAARVRSAALQAAQAMATAPDGDDLGELGVDVVVDADDGAHVIEVNGKPRGRLDALATAWPERFTAARDEALLRPLRFAAWRAGMLHPQGPRAR